MNEDFDILDSVISLLDIVVIISIEDEPLIGIVLALLLKIVCKDKLIRILLILLVIVLGEVMGEE